VTRQGATDQVRTERPGTEHAATERPATRHAGTERAGTEHEAADHEADQAAADQSAADEGATASGEHGNPMALPWRRTPLAFRWWWIGCVLALPLSFAALALWAPGPSLHAIAAQPGAVILLALILLADLYPTLPWMRAANPFDEFIMSTPLAIAALIVFGPHAAVVFVVAGTAMTLAARMVWWRVLLNAALWGVQGALAAAVLALITGPFTWDQPVPSAAMIPITVVLALVIESLNVVLVGTSVRLAGGTTWREYLADWRSQIAISTIALTAPIPAVLAQDQPALLPLLALAMVAAQSGLVAVTSRTALAGTDPLTSLATRAALQARLRDRLDRLRQPGESVTLMLIDLDMFKKVNDDYGHLVGDRVLVEVSRRLEEATRSVDLVARFGGDEFAILLAGGVSGCTVTEVAERISRVVCRPIQIQDRAVSVGVSVGCAVADERGVDANSLIARADAALYRVKAARPPTPPTAQAAAGLADRMDLAWDEPVWTSTRVGHGRRPIDESVPRQR
jgi:diguanylate cyclase (GGDEF)-like protein